MVSRHYADSLPLILCFPALEILMMQVSFGSFVPAAAVVLNPKESIPWGYSLTAAVVMTAAAGWIVFVFTILWLYCGDDYAQCSYTAVSGSAESGKSDCPLGITESESNTTNSQSSSIADSFQIAHATGEEIELAKKDAATFELLALRTLFFAPPEVDAETEPDPEPEPVRLEALVGDGVLAESEREMEPDGNQDDTWSGCWQASGWGERGIWSGGARQGEAVQYFDEMTVTCF
jgi:hypothetical protein